MRQENLTRWSVWGLKRDYNRIYSVLSSDELDVYTEGFDGYESDPDNNEVATFEFSNPISDGVDVEGLLKARLDVLADMQLNLRGVGGSDPNNPAEWLTAIDFVPCVGSVEVGKLAWVFVCYNGVYALAQSTRRLAENFQPDRQADRGAADRVLALRQDVEKLLAQFEGVSIVTGLLDGPIGEDVDQERIERIFDIPMPSAGLETGRMKASVLASVPELELEYEPEKIGSVPSEQLFARALVDHLSDRRRQARDAYGVV
jgi:hypothetical protein